MQEFPTQNTNTVGNSTSTPGNSLAQIKNLL